MKKIIIFTLAVLSAAVYAQSVKLLPPQTTGGATLREALAKRCSLRNYTGKDLTANQLSNLFYSACGVNRKGENKLTIPTARNAQDLVLYAATKHGIYCYVPETHFLRQIKRGDYRQQLGMQKAMFAKASVVLIYTSDLKKLNFGSSEAEKKVYAGVHAGFAIQNVGLFCAAEGLGNVVIGSYNRKNIPALLGLGKDQPVLMVQLVGTLK
ncbi:MAG: SagB/ThcOx family dehydrogenase [Lentisphaerae bacterium]|nr:SagB/ThcOx family dehydrogenase [Lentisphaerota bacterium]